MNTAGIVWLAIFALSAVTFFAVAAVVTVKGFSDLRHLLVGTRKRR
jgi:hypothetical protein